MIQMIEVLLVAHFPHGRKVEDGDFIDELNLGEYGALPSMRPGQSARVVLFRSKSPPFGGPPGALEQFGSGLTAGLLRAAEWLNLQSRETFASFARNGLKVMLFVDMWIDGDQMDLTLPPRLLAACGDRDIPLRMLTND